MKKLPVLGFILLSLGTLAQEGLPELNRPTTEITIGVSNLKERTTINDLIFSDYFYDSYTLFDYLPTNIPSFNLGVRQKLGKGALRIQGHFGNKHQVHYPDTTGHSYSAVLKNNLNSLSTGGKIGYDFFKQFKFLEINYGGDFVANFNKASYSSENITQDYEYDQFGNYTVVTHEYETSDSYSGLFIGLGLNLGLGIRVSEKIKVGIETQYYILRGNFSSSYKNTNPNNYQSSKESASMIETDVDPMGLIYIAFGF